MHHTKRDIKKLASMTAEEKLARTTPEAFKKRKKLLEETSFYYITVSDMPYEEASEHLILWEKSEKEYYAFIKKRNEKNHTRLDDDCDGPIFSRMYTDYAIVGLLRFYREQGYTAQGSSIDRSSVARPHRHLLKLKPL